jgi:hypothetical protein
MEQLRDAVKDIEETVLRLSETNNRILKNKLDALNSLVGKHCAGVLMEKPMSQKPASQMPAVEPPMPVPVEMPESKMMSKARVIDQTFNKFRTDISDTLKLMGKPLTTQGNKTVSSIWKSAKNGKKSDVEESLKSLGVPESQLAPMSAKVVEEARSYLARTQTRKVKATPKTDAKANAKTPLKTRKVAMRKTLVVPPLSAIPESPNSTSPKEKEVEYQGKKYYVMTNKAVFKKEDDDSVGESVGTWDEENERIISL